MGELAVGAVRFVGGPSDGHVMNPAWPPPPVLSYGGNDGQDHIYDLDLALRTYVYREQS